MSYCRDSNGQPQGQDTDRVQTHAFRLGLLRRAVRRLGVLGALCPSPRPFSQHLTRVLRFLSGRRRDGADAF